MAVLSDIWEWLCLRGLRPEVAIAQHRELQRQIPLLYALLSVNAAAVSYTHFGFASPWLTAGLPGGLILLSVARFAVWLRRRGAVVSAEKAIAQMRATTVLATVITFLYIAVALSMAKVGGPFEQAHVVAFIGVTVTGCIFCLMHLPQAATLVALVSLVPYLTYYFLGDVPVFMAIACNILLLVAVMMRALANSYTSFHALVLARATTERLSRENARLAHTDALSGLPNRRLFFSQLETAVAHAAEAGTPLSVGVLDLDRFKPVNDTYGHAVGDRLLEQVGRRLQAAAGPNVLTARLGGDEFGMMFACTGAEAQVVAQRVCAALIEPFELGEISVSIGCSCGVAAFPEGGRTAHGLFDRADYALYTSKTSARGKATLYSAEHEKRVRADQAVEAAFQAADFEAEFDVHMQPIVDAESGAVVAVETLARWTSPQLGPVRPDVFITVAERTGHVNALTVVLFRKALARMAQLPASIVLSFNLSAHDITSPKTVLSLLSELRQSGVAPTRVIFELTETAVARDAALAEASIRLLRAPGARFALDDFGVGQSSLGALHRLPIDEIKIDRSFVRGLADPAGRKLAAAIVALSGSMRLDCVAEGVETPEQLAILREIGCRYVQGYLVAQPMPFPALLGWLAARDEAAAPVLAAAG